MARSGPGPGQASSGLDARQQGLQYENDQRATTMWYHDHTLGMTRANVYAGPAGFYLLRGGPDDDAVVGTLPGPAPALGDPPGLDYFEIPIAIQDRSFNDDGSLFYPDNRAYFEGLDPSQLQIPFRPTPPATGRATSRRSGTPSSSATRSSSTARPGQSSRSSRAATASAC